MQVNLVGGPMPKVGEILHCTQTPNKYKLMIPVVESDQLPEGMVQLMQSEKGDLLGVRVGTRERTEQEKHELHLATSGKNRT